MKICNIWMRSDRACNTSFWNPEGSSKNGLRIQGLNRIVPNPGHLWSFVGSVRAKKLFSS